MRLIRSTAFLFLLFHAFLSSCSVRLPIKVDSVPRVDQPVSASRMTPSKAETVGVWLLADSLHTSIALPYDWLVENGYRPPAGLRFEEGPERLVVMSWGDRTAYVKRRWLTPFEVFNALFIPSESVTEIIPVSWKIEEVCFQQRIYRGEILRSSGTQLVGFLNGSAKPTATGQPMIVTDAAWGNGFLLDCPHSYFFPRICNVWTGQCLEACGLNINIRQSIFASGVIKQCEAQGFRKVHAGVKGYGR